MARPLFWTTERLAKLRELYLDEHLTAQTIGDRMGMPRKNVAKALSRYGIKRVELRPWSDDEFTALAKLWQTGTTKAAIAAKMDRPLGSVSAQLYHRGLMGRGRLSKPTAPLSPYAYKLAEFDPLFARLVAEAA